MNGPSYMDVSQGHLQQTIQSSVPPPGLAHYSYQTSQPLQGGHHPYGSSPTSYAPYGYPAPFHQGGHPNGPSGHPNHSSLPTLANNIPPGSAGSQQYPPDFDTTGQIAPPGMKPPHRVTATLWEDEGSLCYQVEAGGVCVARREDNQMINGTKLLNVTGMTRGRRDGILKSEKNRAVVKIGPMHLKGVWIPFERALDFANKEMITDRLYPLFVHNIAALLCASTGSSRISVSGTTQVVAGDRRRTASHQDYLRTPQSIQAPLPQSMSHHSGAQPPHSIAPHPAAGINSRSVPQTPATTPPGSSVSHMSTYQTNQPYDATRQMYSAPPQHGNFGSQQGMARYGQIEASPYIKSEMAPPARAGAEDSNGEHKPHDGYSAHPKAEHYESEHEGDYTHSAGPYNGNRTSYGYGSNSTQNSLHGDQQHMSSELTGSPHHKPSGGATPRTTSYSTYPTPQRSQLPSSNLYDVISDNRNASNGAEMYGGHAYPAPYPIGLPALGKRVRELEDADDGYNGPDDGSLKRRRTVREDSAGQPHAILATKKR